MRRLLRLSNKAHGANQLIKFPETDRTSTHLPSDLIQALTKFARVGRRLLFYERLDSHPSCIAGFFDAVQVQGTSKPTQKQKPQKDVCTEIYVCMYGHSRNRPGVPLGRPIFNAFTRGGNDEER